MTLFHYTSNIGAVGIIESSSLYATNYKYLNDFNELRMIKDLIVPVLERDFREEIEKGIENGLISDKLLLKHGSRVYNLQAGQFFDLAMKTTDSLSPIFITSFCRHDNESYEWRNGLLSQWRAYGSHGGCAIEFDEKILTQNLSLEFESYRYNHIAIDDVVYGNPEKVFDADKLAGLGKSFVSVLMSGDIEQIDLQLFYEAVALVNPRLKNIGFKEEGEVRIIAAATKEHPDLPSNGKKTKRIFFRPGNGIPIPTVKIFEDLDSIPIKRIIIGPQINQAAVQYAVKLCLQQCQIDADVTLSETSYIP